MKKSINLLFIATAIILLVPSCVKDNCKKFYTYQLIYPVYKTKAEVRSNVKSNTPISVHKPGKIYLYGNYIFLNEVNKGIHVINNQNPSSPQRIAFIDIPGNVDIAVKNNILYADMYTDLVVMDISNPTNVQVKKFVDKVFPERIYMNGFIADSSKVISDWITKDTTIEYDCNLSPEFFFKDAIFVSGTVQQNSSSTTANPTIGIAGSLARFSIIDNYLYMVGSNNLNTYSISNAENPVFSSTTVIGQQIETIYPFKNKLFIGSQTGMFIYQLNNPAQPALQGSFVHWRACDPVIADDNYAFVTLHSGTICGSNINQLDVLNISNLGSPQMLRSYFLYNPRGLAKQDDLLFICDGKEGIKVFNASNVMNLQQLNRVSTIDAQDIIALPGRTVTVATDGLYQHSFNANGNMQLLSKISITK